MTPFGYRALIDEVNVWVLLEPDEPAGGLMLKGPQGEEKEITKAARRKVGYLLFDSRTTSRGESASQGPGKRMCFLQLIWSISLRNRASTVVPGLWTASPWHHARTIKSEKRAGFESLT